MTHPIVERVAKAITQRTMELAGFWATLPTPTARRRALDVAHVEALPIAHAAVIEALTAMEEPSEGMVVEGRRVIVDAVDSGRMSKHDAINNWRLKNQMRWRAMASKLKQEIEANG